MLPSSSPASDLLTTSATSLLDALKKKPSKEGQERPSRIPALSAEQLLLENTPVEQVIRAAKGLIAGIADGFIVPAEFLQPADCRFDYSLLVLVITFQRLHAQGKKIYYAPHTGATLEPVESLERLQVLIGQHTGQKMTTDLREDELIFGFIGK